MCVHNISNLYTTVSVMKVFHMVIVYVYFGYYIKCGELKEKIIRKRQALKYFHFSNLHNKHDQKVILLKKKSLGLPGICDVNVGSQAKGWEQMH